MPLGIPSSSLLPNVINLEVIDKLRYTVPVADLGVAGGGDDF